MRIEQAFKKYLDNLVAGGHMKYVDVGGATRDGGMTPREAADQMMMADATPEQLISKSL